MTELTYAKVFWSGGSQAVRLPKKMRLETSQVTLERQGDSIVIRPNEASDGWAGFWDRLLPVTYPVRRHATRPVEKRKSL
jgi:virulence-associated protein VagC